jgi:acyl-CoA reductase-like NAD-dependent aldehyde dehydrogenase
MLKTKDMFTLSAIVDKMGLDEDIKEILSARKKKNFNDEEMGEKLIFSIVKKMYKARAEITQLLADISGKTIKDVENLQLKETIELIKKLLQEEGVLSFLSQ